ncbi:MAG: hypothetical protein MSH08_06625 [Ezakiella sp.]|nr:hypothetical protein [Ezakiella sp.]MDD7472000.1 NfeD family protein [Bacillota bacterium]MDY3923964.1 NfeD family protein [Ezakiella sp.]
MNKLISFGKSIPDYFIMILLLISFAAVLCSLFKHKKTNLTIGIVSLIFYVGIVLVKNDQHYLSLILSLMGIFLIFLEFFVPGFQVFGITGLAFLTIGLYGTVNSIAYVLFTVLCLIIISFIIIYYFTKAGYKVGGLEKFVLFEKHTTKKGYVATDSPDLVGKTGVTVTPLRPTGYGIIEDKKYDIYSEDAYIPKDVEFVVTRVKSMKIFVRRK